MMKSAIERAVQSHTQNSDEDNWNLQSIVDYAHGNLLDPEDISIEDLKHKDQEEIIDLIMEKVRAKYEEKSEELPPEQFQEFQKVIVLRTVDTKWMDHIDQMDQLRQGIHLRAYGQNDPLREYQMEGFHMFEEMIASIEDEVAKYIMKAQIRENLQRQEVVKNTQAIAGGQESKKKRKPYVKKIDIGRNDPCPCGSGKKYKNCHGKN